MKKKKSVEIIIDEDGTTSMDGIGFEGKECHDMMGPIKAAIGTVMKQNRKAEFYKKTVKTKNRIKG